MKSIVAKTLMLWPARTPAPVGIAAAGAATMSVAAAVAMAVFVRWITSASLLVCPWFQWCLRASPAQKRQSGRIGLRVRADLTAASRLLADPERGPGALAEGPLAAARGDFELVLAAAQRADALGADVQLVEPAAIRQTPEARDELALTPEEAVHADAQHLGVVAERDVGAQPALAQAGPRDGAAQRHPAQRELGQRRRLLDDHDRRRARELDRLRPDRADDVVERRDGAEVAGRVDGHRLDGLRARHRDVRGGGAAGGRRVAAVVGEAHDRARVGT